MDKKILKTLVLLALPAIVEELLSTLLQYVDTAMVGQLGEQATAAVSVTTTVNWLIGSIGFAIGTALVAILSRSYGEKNDKYLKIVSSQGFLFTIMLGLVLGGASVALSPFIPRWMGADEEILASASEYFLIISIPMLFREADIIFGSCLRAVKKTAPPMIVNMIANVLNVGLNFLFIYGLQMGVKGAAIASAISYTVCGAVMFFVYRKNKHLHFAWKELHFDKTALKETAKIGLPVLATSVVSCSGYVVFASLVTGMGTTVFAAHSLAVTAETIFYIPGYGLRTATTTLVGIALGEGDRDKFYEVVKISVILTVGMMVISGAVLYFTALPLMRLFTSSLEAAEIGAEMLRLVAFTEPFFGLMIVMEGILYGLGKTTYPFVVETIGMWGVRILFTALAVHLWSGTLFTVWTCMIADNIFKAVVLSAPLWTRKLRGGLFSKRKGDVPQTQTD